jgi:hypothetical protein
MRCLVGHPFKEVKDRAPIAKPRLIQQLGLRTKVVDDLPLHHGVGTAATKRHHAQGVQQLFAPEQVRDAANLNPVNLRLKLWRQFGCTAVQISLDAPPLDLVAKGRQKRSAMRAPRNAINHVLSCFIP